MAKQVHIHIHRNKTRDAGEGEGKGRWITLSPSGTHVKVDGNGEITAGPKGMTGKKPSELSKGSKKTAGQAAHASSEAARIQGIASADPKGWHTPNQHLSEVAKASAEHAKKHGASSSQSSSYLKVPAGGVESAMSSASAALKSGSREEMSKHARATRRLANEHARAVLSAAAAGDFGAAASLYQERNRLEELNFNLWKAINSEAAAEQAAPGPAKPTRAPERTPMRQEMRNLQAAGLKEARKLTRSPAQPGMERSINRLQAEADIKEAKERVYARRSESRSKDPDTGFVVHKNTRFDPKAPPLKGSAGREDSKTLTTKAQTIMLEGQYVSWPDRASKMAWNAAHTNYLSAARLLRQAEEAGSGPESQSLRQEAAAAQEKGDAAFAKISKHMESGPVSVQQESPGVFYAASKDPVKPGASGAAPTSQNQKISAEMSKDPKALRQMASTAESQGLRERAAKLRQAADLFEQDAEHQRRTASPPSIPLDTKRTDWKQR